MKTSLRFFSQAVLFAAAALALSAGSAIAQSDISFSAKSIYNGAEPNNASGQIIIYNLPSAASGNIYAGSAEGAFDVLASIGGAGTRQVAGYGIIMEIEGPTGLTFDVDDPPVSGTPNNLENASGTGVTQNAGLSIILGETDVDGYQTGDRSLGVVGLHPVANANTPLSNNDGLFQVPLLVAPGVTGTFTIEMALGGNPFSGFGQSDGTLMSPANIFPNANNTVVVRESRRGDMNGDLNVNAADIGGFIAALNNFNSYQSARPWLRGLYISDFDQSGASNAADIGGFIFALNNPGAGSPAAIPEPSTIALLGIGIACLGGAAYRRRRLKA